MNFTGKGTLFESGQRNRKWQTIFRWFQSQLTTWMNNQPGANNDEVAERWLMVYGIVTVVDDIFFQPDKLFWASFYTYVMVRVWSPIHLHKFMKHDWRSVRLNPDWQIITFLVSTQQRTLRLFQSIHTKINENMILWRNENCFEIPSSMISLSRSRMVLWRKHS